MTPEKWQRIKDVIGAVEILTGPARDAALDSLCAEDAELRREVDSLLAHEDRIAMFERGCWSGAADTAEPRSIGPYRIEGLIGSGGMGTVYLAARDDGQYSKRVAIKVIQSFGGPDVKRRFRNERQILANLEHPSIARLLDGGDLDDGRPYLVMEYVDGRRIDEYVDERKLPVPEILRLFLKVCAAVEFAHQNLVVHRDLKPGNILVTVDGEPRLLDFGIAKLLGESAGMERTTPFDRVLTPSSASPEQVAGGRITTATDVYSLGVLLYRLLTGVSAYAGAPDFAVNTADVLRRYQPPPASLAPGVGPRKARLLKGDLDTILAKTLEKDPARRYPTVAEFAADIQRYVDGRAIVARPTSRLYSAGKFLKRNWLTVSAATLLVLSIAAGSTASVLYARRAQAERARADRRFEAMRRISESLLFEFQDSIQNLPGSTEVRALVTRRALQYLDQLAAENSADPAIQRDLASAYVRIGGILAGDRGAHLGGPDAREKALTGFEKALEIRRRLVKAKPGDRVLRRELLESLWAVAGAKQMKGQTAEALALQQERLRVIGEVPAAQRTADFQYSLGSTFDAMSDLYRTRGDLEQALAYAQRSLAVRQALLDADPRSSRARRVVGLSHEFVGYVLADQRKYEGAAREHMRALYEFEAIAATEPPNVDLQRNMDVAEMNLCEVLARNGAAADAAGHCRRSVALAESMHRADPGNVQASEDLASAYGTMGLALRLGNQFRPALHWDRRGETQYQAALAQDPGSRDAAIGYADVLLELMRTGSELRQSGACEYARRAREVLERLATIAPADRTVQARLTDERKIEACR